MYDDDDIGLGIAEYVERRGLLDTIYSEPKGDKEGMLFGAPWNRVTEYIFRTFFIVAALFALMIVVLACG